MPITQDPERLGMVAGALGAAIRDRAPGERVRLPVLQRADAAGLTMVLYAALDAAIEQRAAQAQASGGVIACAGGCNACCESPVIVPEAEAVTVAEWIVQPEHAAILQSFVQRYRPWKQAMGDLVAALPIAAKRRELAALADRVRQRAAMCPFNADGPCSIYEVRPALCRKAHALDTNEFCGPSTAGNVSYYEHPQTEMVYEEQAELRMAMHHALRPSAPLDLLPAAVYRVLYGNLSRNAPCPCGSGNKYKRCCA